MDSLEMKNWLDKQLAGMKIEAKTMFGNPAYLVNGNMFAKIEKGKFVVRLDPKDRDDLAAKTGAEKYVMFNGMVTKDYIAFGPALTGNADILAGLKKGFEYIKKMPAKEKAEKKDGEKKSRCGCGCKK